MKAQSPDYSAYHNLYTGFAIYYILLQLDIDNFTHFVQHSPTGTGATTRLHQYQLSTPSRGID